MYFDFVKILKKIAALPMISIPVRWAKNHSLPGFSGVPVWEVLVFLYRESMQSTLLMRANATAFSFFLSLFPGILFLFSLATVLPIYSAFEHEINGYIDIIMPSNAGEEVKATIKKLVKPNTNFLSIGFILSLYFASNGMQAMIDGFAKSYHRTFRRRGFIRQRLIAIALVIQLGILLASSVVLIILGDLLIGFLARLFEWSFAYKLSLKMLRWIVILLLIYFGIATIYRYGPAMHQRFRWITPGATLATILSVLSSLVFSFYVESFNTYNKVYGSIGTIIVLMLWIQINCFILLAGFELNASIAVNRDMRKALLEK